MNSPITRRISVALLLVGLARAAAQESPDPLPPPRKSDWVETVQIAPFAGLRFGGGLESEEGTADFSTDPDACYGVALNLNLLPTEDKIELVYSHQDTSVTGDSLTRPLDLKVDMFMVGLIREFEHGKLTPFLSGLLGMSYFDGDGGSDLRFAFGLGGGVKYYPTRNVGLRFDLRGYGTVVDGEISAICSGGCLVAVSGSLYWQGEITGGLEVRF